MVPLVVLVDHMPLTDRGKIDLAALPAPTLPAEASALRRLPKTELQQLLAELWSEILSLDAVPVDANFFDLGGHSLLATQVMSRIRARLRVELPLRTLFESPTISELAARIEDRRRVASGVVLPPIVPVDRGEQLPLSFAEQRLWFLNQMRPDSAWYNMPGVARLSGELDVEVLRRAFEQIVLRHESLRTNFRARAGQPERLIRAPRGWTLPVVDLSTHSEDAREHEAQRLVLAEAERPFDLEHDSLLRTTLLRLDTREHLLLLSMHHIVSDGWSVAVLLRELGALVRAFTAGEPSPLPPLPIQYADFTQWQRRWIEGEVLEAQLAHWKTKLEGTPTLVLPSDRPRPSVSSYRGGMLRTRLPAPSLATLTRMCREHDVTMYMAVLGVFQVLLARRSGQQDFAIGTAIANRNRGETEGLIGFFVNTLVMRMDASGDPSFSELLSRVRGVVLDAYDHQDLPFERLVDELEVSRDLSRMPLVQVMFTLQNEPKEPLELPGLELRVEPFEWRTTKFDLTLFAEELDGELELRLEYSADLFDPSTAEQLLAQLETLIDAVLERPEEQLSRLPLLRPHEREAMIRLGNRPPTPFPDQVSLIDLFRAQVARTPKAIALEFEDGQLDYAGLEARANRVAHQLLARGVGLEDRIGVCVERSAEMVVMLLGIMRSEPPMFRSSRGIRSIDCASWPVTRSFATCSSSPSCAASSRASTCRC